MVLAMRVSTWMPGACTPSSLEMRMRHFLALRAVTAIFVAAFLLLAERPARFAPGRAAGLELERGFRELGLRAIGGLLSGRTGDDGETAHIRTQRFRHDDAAIRLLIIFEHGDQGAADRKAGPVQGMDEPGALVALGLEA